MSTSQVSQTIVRDEVFTRHDFNVLRPGYKDNAYERRVLLSLLRGHKIAYTGGKYMSMGVQLGSTAQGGSFSKGERGTLADVNNETDAIYTPAYYREPRVIYMQDEVESGGDNVRQLTLMESKTDDAIERMLDDVRSDLCATSKANSKDLNTLLEAVTDGATGAFGTLDPANAGQSNWANQDSGNFDFSASARSKLRTLMNNSSAGGKFKFDVIMVPQTYHEQYLEIADGIVSLNTDAHKLSTGQLTSNIAIENATIFDRPIIWDTQWSTDQASKGLMLDLRGIQLAVHPSWEFKPSEWKSAEVDGIAARCSWVYLVAQLVMDSRRTQGFIGTLS